MRARQAAVRAASILSAVIALGGAAAAQQSPGRAGQPPLLSSTPTPPAGAKSEPSQMSGLPLQVGDLPPGTVAVRVVRRSFASNVVNQRVDLEVVGANGRVLQGTTDAVGRALFTGLRVGDVVVARATVDGESLESQRFELPSQGGVRVALVSGIGAGTPGTAGTPPPSGGAPPAPSQAQPVGSASAARPWWIVSSVFGALGLGVLILGARRFRRERQQEAATSAPLDDAAAAGRREALFQKLVSVEDDYAAGRIGEREYRLRRTALIDELVEVDSAAG